MRSAHLAGDADQGELALFLDQVRIWCDRRVGATADPLDGLARLGLIAAADEVPVWAQLDEADWFALLRGIARCDPALAAALSGLRLTLDCLGGPGVGWIAWARRSVGHWQFRSPVSPAPCAHWAFYDGERIRRVPAAALRHGADGCLECADDAAAPDARPTPALSRFRRDRLALISGCLWQLWTVTVDHAETRPMFRRCLGDFPAIRIRLLLLLAQLLRADALIERAAAATLPAGLEPHLQAGLMGALRRCAGAIRTDTQQICGGSGYMRESRYAQALDWLDWCDGLMRLGPISDAALADGVAAEIDRSAARRLAGAGIGAQQSAMLLPPPAGRRSGRSAWTPA